MIDLIIRRMTVESGLSLTANTGAYTLIRTPTTIATRIQPVSEMRRRRRNSAEGWLTDASVILLSALRVGAFQARTGRSSRSLPSDPRMNGDSHRRNKARAQ